MVVATAIVLLLAGCGSTRGGAGSGDPAEGNIVITRQACGSCHRIPGIDLADGTVGPPLTHIASQRIIAGRLANSPAALTVFLRSPQSVVPGGTMPDIGLTQGQARDAVAYLLTLK